MDDDPLHLHSLPTRRSSDLTAAAAPSRRAAAPSPHRHRLRLRPAGASRVRVECALRDSIRSEEHTSELQSRRDLVCRLLLEKKKPMRLLPTRSLSLYLLL